MTYIERPPVLKGSAEQQILQLWNYLYTQAEAHNCNLAEITDASASTTTTEGGEE